LRPLHDPKYLLLAATALMSVGLLGCWQAPGGGVAKGCLSSASFVDTMGAGLGISSHIEWGDSRTETAYRDFEKGKWAELGAGSARTDFTWARIESQPGVFDFSGLDRVVEAGEESGTDLLAILDYGNSWANSSGEEAAPPDESSDFGNYAAAVAARYAGRVRHYEIWNEQNVGLTFWRPREDPVRYAELLVEASARVRQADPEALISFGGVFTPRLLLNTEGEDYIREVAAALPELAQHIDIMAFHPYRYPFSAPELQSEARDSLAGSICSMRDLVGEIGAPDMPLWITELGWHTAPESFSPGVDEATQGAYLARAALISFSQGVERFYWYTFRDSGTADDDQEQRFGLFSWDEIPGADPPAVSKSAVEFRALSEVLADHESIRDRSEELGLDGRTWALAIDGGSAPAALALWTHGEAQTIEVGRDVGNTLVDTAGSELALSGGGTAWQIEVSARPVYLLKR